MRKEPLVTNEIYHIMSRSIAGFKIFDNPPEFSRILAVLSYYQTMDQKISFSQVIKSDSLQEKYFDWPINNDNRKNLVDIVTYCIMPTHIHLVLKQLKENGISIFMSNILNSYTRYFNTKVKRKGPLWETRFKNVLVRTDEQLLHLTRYIHLNPVTSYLVDKPENWPASSYKEYLSKNENKSGICRYEGLLDIEPSYYKKFVENRIDYQRSLAKIKSLTLE